jgi:hypothetical protein
MDVLFGILAFSCVVAAIILAVMLLIRLFTKKPKKWIGLSALFCVVGAILFSIVGSQVWLSSMTTEEREACYAEQRLQAEKREAEMLAADSIENSFAKTMVPTISPNVTAMQTPKPTVAPTNTPKPTPTSTPIPTLSPSPTADATQLEAERAEQERLSVTFEEIYKAYKENELRADDKYQYNRYRITAKINGMSTDGLFNLTGGATLTMEKRVGSTIVFFYAEFEKEQEEALKKINVGDTITFEGECLSAGNWIECEIIE